jgi:hypothetical protein
MAIKFKIGTTIDELKLKIHKLDDDYSSGIETVFYDEKRRTDPYGVKFDCENITYEDEQFDMPGFTAGYAMLDSKLPVRWVGVGGDWEMPVAACVYIGDDDELKVYVPKAGNVWNFNTKHAIGNSAEMGQKEEMESLGVKYTFDMDAMQKEMLGQ